MKKSLLLVVSLFMLFVCSSCKTAEQKYVDEYTRFAESFLKQSSTYTAADWEAAATRYAQLREQYATYLTDLTPEQRQTIEQYNSKINAEFIKHETDSASEKFKSLLKETVGTLNELLEQK